ncbi:hypothetical protein LTR66_017025, partial [Elasticomyces elasticus]
MTKIRDMEPETPGSHEGVLTQTLTSSPAVKTILPAKIRSPSLNDVVFVGHTAIHLHQFFPNAHVSSKIASLELGTQILAAKVVSAEAQTVSVEDIILGMEKDEVRYKIGEDYVEDGNPPQILVLSLATGELAFVYAKTSPDHSSHFVYAKRKIAGFGLAQRSYGKHMVIDHSHRILAVAPAHGEMTVLALKSVDKLKNDIDNWDPRDPSSMKAISEQRFIRVDGTILKMDFLHPAADEPDWLMLVLLVANAGLTKILAYKWHISRPLTTMQRTRSSGHPIAAEDAFPDLFIPSRRPDSFAIVVKDKLTYYNDVDQRNPTRVQSSSTLPSSGDKLWVQWTKPVRQEYYAK